MISRGRPVAARSDEAQPRDGLKTARRGIPLYNIDIAGQKFAACE
jgi:hypothetical protein